MEALKTYNFVDGRKLEIFREDDPQSPRTWDNLGDDGLFSQTIRLW
ncbi:hypothetical protein LCGC14_2108830 [marine sediment metagenome]|uniref:Uncharacterized protein n=1 Tax=marine sediment metagenome TaxID=412755 RepID=A0A0F9E7M3_9ZZZZ